MPSSQKYCIVYPYTSWREGKYFAICISILLLQRYPWNCSNVPPNLTLTFRHLPTMCKGGSVCSSSINWGEKFFSLKLAVRFLGRKKKKKGGKKENTFHQKPKFYFRKMAVALLWSGVDNQSREKFTFFLIRPFRSCHAGTNNKFSTAVLHPISFDFHRKKKKKGDSYNRE